MRRSTFADTQKLASRSPRHASARRATDTTRIQTKALILATHKAGDSAARDRTHRPRAARDRPHRYRERPSTLRPRGTHSITIFRAAPEAAAAT